MQGNDFKGMFASACYAMMFMGLALGLLLGAIGYFVVKFLF